MWSSACCKLFVVILSKVRQTTASVWTNRIKSLPLDQAHGALRDRFRGESVYSTVLESKDVTRQMKCANLAPPIRQQFVGAHPAFHDLIDILARYAELSERIAAGSMVLRAQEKRGDGPGSGSLEVKWLYTQSCIHF